MSIHRKRERMLRKRQASIDAGLARAIRAAGEDVMTFSKTKFWVNLKYLCGGLPLRDTRAPGIVTRNGMRLADMETVRKLAKWCGQSMKDFERQYS